VTAWEQELERQMDEVAALIDWDLTVIAQRVQPALRGTGWVVWTLTASGLSFEVSVDNDNVAGAVGTTVH
jgi:hypothetical protein